MMMRSSFFILISLLASAAYAQEALLEQAETVAQEIVPEATQQLEKAKAIVLTEEQKANFVPSFGENPITLLYSPDAINPYFDNIAKYERDGFEVESLTEEEKATLAVTDAENPEAPPAPPIIYPHYYVSSIIYDRPDAWSVYINGILITSSNNAADKELFVQSITRDEVRVRWTPQDERVIPQIKLDKTNKDTALLPQIMEHRAVMINAKNAVFINSNNISFLLEPNQFFASGYLKVLEGNPSSLSIVSYYPDGMPVAEGAAPAAEAAPEDASILDSIPKDPPEAGSTDTPIPEKYQGEVRQRKTIAERIKGDSQ
jgi:hypothetical protein